jgi:hypothetical protein
VAGSRRPSPLASRDGHTYAPLPQLIFAAPNPPNHPKP